MEATALGFLDDAVKDMNTHLYEFNRTVETGLALVEDQEYVELVTTYYRESQAFTVRTSDGFKYEPLCFIPWAQFLRMTQMGVSDIKKTSGELISHYSIRNEHATGTMFLYPTPNATAASDFTLTVEYYRRIPLISSTAAGASIDCPPEIETALVYGAQKRMAMHIEGAEHPSVGALNALEETALNRLKAVDQRHVDEKLRFRIVDNTTGRTRTDGRLYVEL